MKKFFEEFAKFIKRGNVMDLAVGIIIGAAFKDIVNSLVNDMLMPIVGLGFKFDVKSAVLILKGSQTGVSPSGLPVYTDGAVLLRWGGFVQSILDFIIIAFFIFSIIKILNVVNDGAKKKKDKFIAQLEKKIAKGHILTEAEQNKVDAASAANAAGDANAAGAANVAGEEAKPSIEDILLDIKDEISKLRPVEEPKNKES